MVKIRRAYEVLFLGLFLFFLVITDLRYLKGWPVSLFLEATPLVAVGTALTTHTIYRNLVWGLVIIAITMMLGRVWCNWMCPFGIMHHFFGWIGNRRNTKQAIEVNRYRKIYAIKYYILAACSPWPSSGSSPRSLTRPRTGLEAYNGADLDSTGAARSSTPSASVSRSSAAEPQRGPQHSPDRPARPHRPHRPLDDHQRPPNRPHGHRTASTPSHASIGSPGSSACSSSACSSPTGGSPASSAACSALSAPCSESSAASPSGASIATLSAAPIATSASSAAKAPPTPTKTSARASASSASTASRTARTTPSRSASCPARPARSPIPKSAAAPSLLAGLFGLFVFPMVRRSGGVTQELEQVRHSPPRLRCRGRIPPPLHQVRPVHPRLPHECPAARPLRSRRRGPLDPHHDLQDGLV